MLTTFNSLYNNLEQKDFKGIVYTMQPKDYSYMYLNHIAISHATESQKKSCREFTPTVVEWHQQQPPPMYSQDESASVEYTQMHTKPGWKLQAQQLTY